MFLEKIHNLLAPQMKEIKNTPFPLHPIVIWPPPSLANWV